MGTPEHIPPIRPPVARPRPTDTTEEELGFTRQRAVRWLAPSVLITTGAQSLIASIFGSFADKRELQGSLPALLHRHDDAEELWLDYVADLGDGFDATYSVASLLAAPSVDVAGAGELPRGRLLVFGGDEVYPAASTRAYEDRSKAVYRAALPMPQGTPPRLFALPANHDWYDGLTAFLRVFAQRRPFGGWETEQTRSYFAIQLPQRWWLFAIDTQFDDYVDAPQLEYFRQVADQNVREGDAIILCTSTPAWVPAGSGGESKGYDTVEFFNREIIRPRKAEIRVMLTGDRHHYARYAERGGGMQLVTCGLGGAYTSATHKLPEELELPPAKSRVRAPSEHGTFDLLERYPDEATSRALTGGIFRLPWRNPGFWALTGIAQTAMTLAMLLGLRSEADGTFQLLAAWAPAVAVAAVLVLGGTTFARIDLPKTSKTNTIAGALHAIAHLALSVGWGLVILWLDRDVFPDGVGGDLAILGVVAIGTPVVVGFLDAELVAVYLLVASTFCVNLNEAFAGQSIEDHKGFLRLHIDRAGTLTIYPVKIPVVCRAWKLNTGAESESEPWFLPEGTELTPELIERPITVPHSARVPVP